MRSQAFCLSWMHRRCWINTNFLKVQHLNQSLDSFLSPLEIYSTFSFIHIEILPPDIRSWLTVGQAGAGHVDSGE